LNRRDRQLFMSERVQEVDNDPRVAEIRCRAIEVLGSEEAADAWIEKQSATLGASPREVLATGAGRNRVLLHLNGISRHRVA
jgi:uncharacterized protein (DUF2384 family)